jgi:Protein of unknown function (DUF2652)
MTPARTLLVIADIGGYTDYMRTHRMSLAHAEVNTTRLLEKVIDAVPDFDLIEIEGDAAFLARRADTSDGGGVAAEWTLEAAIAMHRAFHVERHYVATNLCPCGSCTEATNLKLKFVAHVGEVATQTIRQRRKLVGIDVILVHRLLKNTVDVPEYVLMSEDLYRTGGSALPAPARETSQELEGIGPVRAYVVDVSSDTVPPPPLPLPTLTSRLGRTLGVAGSGLPYMLGLRRTRRGAARPAARAAAA